MNTVLDHSSDLGADSLKMRLDLLIGNPENFQTIGLQAFITGSSRESRPQGPLSYGTRKLCSIRVNLPDLPKAPPLGELTAKQSERAAAVNPDRRARSLMVPENFVQFV